MDPEFETSLQFLARIVLDLHKERLCEDDQRRLEALIAEGASGDAAMEMDTRTAAHEGHMDE